MFLVYFLNSDDKTKLKLWMKKARIEQVTKKRLKIIEGDRISQYNKNLSTSDIAAKVMHECVEAVVWGANSPKREVLRELKGAEDFCGLVG